MAGLATEVIEAAKEGIEYGCNISTDKDNNIVIGETHVNTQGLTEEEKERRTKLLAEQPEDTIFVVENDMSTSVGYKQIGGVEDTFMDQTIKYAKENERTLIVMDEEISHMDSIWSRYPLWKAIGSVIGISDFQYMAGICNLTFVALHKNPEDANKYITEAKGNIERNDQLTEEQKKPFIEAAETVVNAISKGALDKLSDISKTFIQLDGIYRERYYQEKIAEIKMENPGKKIFSVFGRKHQEGIIKTMDDPNYRTPMKGAKMLWEIDDLKDNYL